MEFTKSRLRRKILTYFFSNVNAKLYVREIAGILKEDPGNVSKELCRMEKNGIFLSVIRGRQKYFCLNMEYMLYDEIKSIVFKTIGIEGSLRETISGINGIDSAFIYGSFADGRENDTSDIDLLIVGSPNEDELMRRIEKLEDAVKRDVNYNIYSQSELKNRLKQKHSFIYNILNGRKVVLKGKLD